MNKKIYIYIYIAIAAVVIVGAGIYAEKNVSLNTSQPPLVADQTTPASNEENTSPAVDNTPATTKPPVVLGNYGTASEFKTGNTWLNSQPLTIASLKGKVVLVDFWTYSCINCIRTLPYVTKWYDKYKDSGLVVIGVHTPEFAFERDTNNVKNAISQFNIHYPVVQDNDYAIWNSYHNQYWPAEYLIDKTGKIVEEHFGEGDYDKTENTIRYLLGMDAANIKVGADNLNSVGSPEMYFGTDRLEYLTSSQQASSTSQNYTLDQNVALNKFSLGGSWKFSGTATELVGASGQINLKFHAGKVHIVAASQAPATLSIMVDGRQQPSVTVQGSKLYTLFDSKEYTDHVIQIEVNQPGFQAFTFTFG